LRVLYQGFPVEVRRADDGTVAARSLLCTHTGCEVVWMPQRQLYHCPCHEGLFDVAARIEGEEVVVGDEA
jgi:Rieske Fe-S protein